jgi:hypothetical protein
VSTANKGDGWVHLFGRSDRLGLVEPRLVHRRAHAVAGTGDLPAAIALLDTGLAARDGSNDRAWADLTAYRDALAARQAAAERGRPVRPHRRGHSSATATSPRRTSPRPRPKAGSARGVS